MGEEGRVRYLTRSWTPHDARFVEALVRRKWRVDLLRLERLPGEPDVSALPPGAEQLRWSGGTRPFRLHHLPTLVTEMRRLTVQRPVDVVHAGPIPTAGLVAALAGARPLVTMSWGSDLLYEARRSLLVRWSASLALRHSHAVIADCETVRKAAISLGAPADRIAVFPWGVDVDRFRPEPGEGGDPQIGTPGDFVILSSRAWEPVYGVDIVIDAFIIAAQRCPRIHLLMLGRGSLGTAFRELLERSCLADRVTWVGQVGQDELPGYYRAADLFVSASHTDGSSISLLEAMSCGTPVAVSDIPANREWVEQGEQGWRFPDGDAGRLSAVIVEAAASPGQLGAMGRKARATATSRADWRRGADKLVEAYRMAIEASAESAALHA